MVAKRLMEVENRVSKEVAEKERVASELRRVEGAKIKLEKELAELKKENQKLKKSLEGHQLAWEMLRANERDLIVKVSFLSF